MTAVKPKKFRPMEWWNRHVTRSAWLAKRVVREKNPKFDPTAPEYDPTERERPWV